MSDSIQTQGKTVNDAVSEALLQLGLRRDEVEIKVIEEPRSGLLGFIGGRQAKVMVRKKSNRRGGRGRRRAQDDASHSLSDGGRGRGGRGGRGGRRDGRPQRGRADAAAEVPEGKTARDEAPSGSGGNSRGRRGGRRDSQDARSGGRGQDRAKDKRSRDNADRANPVPEATGRSDQEREDGRRDASRRGGRGRGRNRKTRTDQEVTVERSEEKTSRSRRTGRGGRGRGGADRQEGNQSNETVAASAANPSASVVVENTSVGDAPNFNRRENADMTENTQSSAPKAARTEKEAPTRSAATAPAPQTPVVAPKAKRKGWGGGIGSRLPRKPNPAAKNKPEPVVIAEAPQPQVTASSRGPRDRDRSRGREDFNDRISSSSPGEVIIDAVAATKYAKPVADVNEENLNTSLADLTSGMLARAGFPCEVEVNDGEYRQVVVSSDDESAGMLIGRHGQTVDAVEHLVERMACNAVDDRVRMNLDINGYRQRRSESLQERVAAAIAEVRETGKPYHVEPMSARERRLVHLEVEPVSGIRTYTMIGSGGKYVVIALDDESDESARDDG